MKRLIPVLAALFWCQNAFAAYTYTRTVTVAHTLVPSTLSNFPVMVCANGTSPCNTSVAGLNQSGGGAHIVNLLSTPTRPADLVFSTVTGCGSGLLSWEIERYVAATGEIIAWVKISSVSSSSDTVFYMCYGDAAVVTYQGGSAGAAWDSDFNPVLHFTDGTTLSVADSTSNATNGTNHSGTATTGKLDGGLAVASSAYVSTADHADFDVNSLTVEAWIKTSTSGADQSIVSRDDIGSNRIWLFRVNTSDHVQGIWFTDSGNTSAESTATVTDGNWHHVAFIVSYNGSTTFTLTTMIDGAQDGTNTSGDTPKGGGTLGLFVGILGDAASNNFTGSFDDGRFSKVARAQGWITAEYNNGSSPSTFDVIGAESGGAGATCKGALTLLGVGGC